MKHVLPEPIQFKYRGFDASDVVKQSPTGSGSFDGSKLTFGGVVVDMQDLSILSVIDSFFMMGIQPEGGEFQELSVEIFATDTKRLKNAIDAGQSSASAETVRTQLSAVGKLNTYRDEICPFCKSTIMLTDLPESEQIYCSYCNTLFSRDRSNIGDIEQYFRICQSCGMYSRPREFAVFYFYFLVVTFGFHHGSIIRCSGCMRRSAWKMVAGNLFGLLGFPFALIQLYRSYATKKISGQFEGLDDANSLASKGKIDSALERYDEIMDNVGENAGVKFNVATGLMLKRDFAHAQTMFELSLDDCSNYWPSVHGLLISLQQQGKIKEVAAVEKLWSLADSHYEPTTNIKA